jgi:hypothetical protein
MGIWGEKAEESAIMYVEKNLYSVLTFPHIKLIYVFDIWET